MNDDYTTEKIIEIASGLDRIFYFVCPENLQLRRDVEQEVADDLAEKLGLTLYGKRSGPNIQDPKTFHKELSNLRYYQFDIVYVSKQNEEISLLSHQQKLDFVEDLSTKSENSGLIAKRFVDESEGVTEWEDMEYADVEISDIE